MLFIVLLFGFVSTVKDKDPCQGFDTYFSRDDALKCATTVPFDGKLFNEILNGFVENIGGDIPHIDMQIYHDINKYSGYPWYIKVDLFEEIDKLKKTTFTNWFDAIDSVWNVWATLKDVHTGYSVDNILSTLVFLHPISILPVYDASTNTISLKIKNNDVTKGIFDAYNSVYHSTHKFEEYDDWKITKINGEDPVEFIKKFTKEHVYFGRDLGANFNELVKQGTSIGVWRYYQMSKQFMPLPKSPITYDIENSASGAQETLSNIDYISCFWNATSSSCVAINSSKTVLDFVFPEAKTEVSESTQKNDQQHLKVPHVHLKDEEKSEMMKSYYESGDYEAICVSTKMDFVLWLNKDEQDIGFFQVMGEGDYDDDGNVYGKDVIRCVKEIKSRKFKKLVLDLRWNGGGLPRLSFTIASAISRITFPDPGQIQTPLISTIDTYNMFLNDKFGYFNGLADLIHPKFYDHPNHQMVMPDGHTIDYAPLFRMDLSNYYSYPNLKEQTGFEGFEPEDLIVLSHGAAISAGGEFFKFMQLTKSGKIVVIGGFPDLPIDGSCVDGGFTSAITNTYKNMRGGEYPSTLRLTLGSVFPQSPLYSVYDKSKTDYTKFYELQETMGPDFRHFTYLDLGMQPISQELLDDLKEDFAKCVRWNIRVNSSCEEFIEHGVFGNPCVDGKYDPKVCVLKRCGDGFFMNEDQTKCLEISSAPLYKLWEESFEEKNNGCPTEKKKSSESQTGYIIGVAAEGGVILLLFVGLLCCCCVCVFVVIVCSALLGVNSLRGKVKPGFDKYDEL